MVYFANVRLQFVSIYNAHMPIPRRVQLAATCVAEVSDCKPAYTQAGQLLLAGGVVVAEPSDRVCVINIATYTK